jgi:hypothetical protein
VVKEKAMFSCKNEEMMIKALIQKNKENPSEILTFVFENGISFTGIINTFYETDNGLEMDEEGYQEYYVCAVSVENGRIEEIGGSNLPKAVYLEDNTILWSK